MFSVFSNFCPNEVIKCCHRDAPWMTNVIKQRLKEKTKIYNKYVKNKYDVGYKELLDICKRETCDLISSAKEIYYKCEGKKLLDPSLGPKMYWPILNSFLGKNKVPEMPPLFDNGDIVSDYLNKAEIFKNYFALQCTALNGNHEVPSFHLGTSLSLSTIKISEAQILEMIRTLDPPVGMVYLPT